MVNLFSLNNSELESGILTFKHSKKELNSAIGDFYTISPYIFLSLTFDEALHRQLQDGPVINTHYQGLIIPNQQPTNIGNIGPWDKL